jgi:hypothetical protein
MKGRRHNRASGGLTDRALRESSLPGGARVSTKVEAPVMRPKKLAPVGGKKAVARLDKPARGRAGSFKGGGGIHIKPSHRGLLTKEVGKKGLKPGNLRKEIARDKKEGNVAKEKREVFALNAKTKFHH